MVWVVTKTDVFFPSLSTSPKIPQHSPVGVTNSLVPYAYGKAHKKIAWEDLLKRWCLPRLINQTESSCGYVLPTGRDSWYFMHMQTALSILKKELLHIRLVLLGHFLEQSHPSFQYEWVIHNPGRGSQFEPFFPGKASRLPAIQNLIDHTISVDRLWWYDIVSVGCWMVQRTQ